MEQNPLEKIAKSWIAAINNNDADALASLYEADAVHKSPNLRKQKPETLGIITGRDAIREWERRAFSTMPSLHYVLREVTTSGDRAWIDYIRTVDGQPPRNVAELLIVRKNLIIESRVYNG